MGTYLSREESHQGSAVILFLSFYGTWFAFCAMLVQELLNVEDARLAWPIGIVLWYAWLALYRYTYRKYNKGWSWVRLVPPRDEAPIFGFKKLGGNPHQVEDSRFLHPQLRGSEGPKLPH